MLFGDQSDMAQESVKKYGASSSLKQLIKKGFRNGSLFNDVICIYLKSVSGIPAFTFTSFTLKLIVCPPVSVFLSNANLIPLISL